MKTKEKENEFICLVKDVKRLARKWVEEKANQIHGFIGAFLQSSINWMPEDAPWSATSDDEIAIVVTGVDPKSIHRERCVYHGLLSLS